MGFGFITSWGGSGAQDGRFDNPEDAAADSTFNVYVPDRFNNRVQKFTSLGGFIRKFGNFESFGVTVGQGDTVFVTNFSGDSIQRFSPDGVGAGSFGSSGAGTNPPQYREPWGAAVDAAGNVYVADSVNGRILKTTANGGFLQEIGKGTLSSPFGVAVDQAGNVYAADSGNKRIVRFNPSGTVFTSWGSQGAADGQFDGAFSPWDVAVDPGGNVYATDRGNNRVQKFSAVGQFLGKFGTTGAGNGEFSDVHGLGIDIAGNVYVADTGNNRIQRWGDTANLLVSMTPSVSSLFVGGQVTFTARVGNAGPDPSVLVRAPIALPAGATPLQVQTSQGTCAGTAPVTCSLGTIPAFGEAVVSVTLRADAAVALPVQANAASPTFDPAANNTALASATAFNQPPQAGPTPSPSTPSTGAPRKAAAAKATIASLAFAARWKESRLAGTLRLRGTAQERLRVRALIRRARRVLAGQPVPQVLRALTLPKGRFDVRVALPATLPPGSYRVTLIPTTAGGGSKIVVNRPATLSGPPEGAVVRAFTSVLPKGSPVLRVPRTKSLNARFTFASLPRRGRAITATWVQPGGRALGTAKKPRASTVETGVFDNRSLPPGTWHCVLRAGGVVVKRVAVRVG
jgi:sugar lactone lactonase YvrE